MRLKKQMLKKSAYSVIILSFLGLAACDLEEDCSGTVSATYTMGTDATVDFTASDVAASAEVLTSDCDNLSAGQKVDETIDSVVRSGDTLTLTEGDEVITMNFSGNDVQEFTKSETIAGCTITVLLSGSLDPSTNIITTSGAFAAKGLTCNTSL